ncbi:YdhK family protein [Nesterenkonia alkaliphila]|uniref:DUF1541 domain-containing protein n=1 Tax=Nesterenkonia alkaliphila TaxID=1463631 RepID=A0A7K1UM09_9MICC|nr:YdhK family protein [Nesterenkonia alkaliphila]MVT27456.1 DUF1541 domain-containing protein [Nesterenkonia alkaliphila]GFZ89654.1 hypothetical protein GCM10011359_18660 [Nesterenkonia alkaliphila]
MSKALAQPPGAAAFNASLVLTGCASDAESEPDEAPAEHEDHGEDTEDGHEHMGHPEDGGPVPEGMAEAAAPEYADGEEVTLTADHMPGMDGAPATIVGAYDTFTYSVDYTPTTGGDPVTDHKWVVHEELEDAGDQRLEDGTEVTLAAEHMEGMDGATATIFSSTEETVYVVDVEAEDMTMTNHKWVVESEIEPTS